MIDNAARGLRHIDWRLFVPKLVTTLREGYDLTAFRHDAIAGLTVAIVALPLAMALAIASGASPAQGLITAVVAGFLISALGGSRFQIGGPTGAFVVVVYGVIDQYGYDGLLLATLMAGVMLIVAGFARFGTWIKYIPDAVVTGFTSGIAVIIFSSQIKDIFGLQMADVPAEFVDKWHAMWVARDTVDPATVAIAAGALALILALRRYAPKAPGFLIAVVLASLVVALAGLPVDTIGSRFGGIPSEIPMPRMPEIGLARMAELLPSAFTIAFLAGVESLLSAMVADGMTGRRHRSNCELVAQGVANTASALFGGLPATGAIARTATNIRAGARSPISGMLHAAFLLLFMLVAAPLAAFIPLASLAAVLVIVAWNMSEVERFRQLMSAPLGDRLVLLVTFGLTVLVDLTVAIEVGVVLAAVLFMHRMSEVVAIGRPGTAIIERDEDDETVHAHRRGLIDLDTLPPEIQVLQMRGPLFFGVANRLADVVDRIGTPPRVYIMRMREVPIIDSSGASRLREFLNRARRHHATVILSGLQREPKRTLIAMRILHPGDGVRLAPDFAAAIDLADRLIADQPTTDRTPAAE